MKNIFSILLFLFNVVCYSQNNCPATTICGTFSNTPNGFGQQELNGLNRGCLSIEHNSTWIKVNIVVSGTFQFTINPNNNNDDFDFAVWTPNSPCPPTNNPIRCSYAVGNNNFPVPTDDRNTGISTLINNTHPQPENNNNEGIAGNGWVNDINVIAGQSYIILVDNFTTNNGFQITFGGTSVINCFPLPIELSYFVCETKTSGIELKWQTATEINNDYFIIEKCMDGVSWKEIAKIDGAGNSSSYIDYTFMDLLPDDGTLYYRLTQVDLDGKREIFYNSITSCNFYAQYETVNVYNIAGQFIYSFQSNNAVLCFKNMPFATGIYILEIKYGTETKIMRIFK